MFVLSKGAELSSTNVLDDFDCPDSTWEISKLGRLYHVKCIDWQGYAEAANKFKGEHDFRNFCKMDAVNVKNFRRYITGITISPCNKKVGSL
ncbi:hypothetical protein HPP92_016851 [Vanilla planifolia]|uniref:Pseudouridine synthase I TruA alpha/beta domain-containing protein n=1 Tax=Vanilla planifolia TaxID=51239 RepID=A0A835QBN6_VANPL|nr:hypothetical protein HPP92_016851 [Vanilla planifolia]